MVKPIDSVEGEHMNNQFPPLPKKDETSGKVSGFPKLPSPPVSKPPVIPPVTPQVTTPPPTLRSPNVPAQSLPAAPVAPQTDFLQDNDTSVDTETGTPLRDDGEPEEWSENEDGTVNVYMTEGEYKDFVDYEAALTPEDLSIEALYILASSKEAAVREILAANEFTPPSVLAMLANDQDELVREAVVYNPSTNDETYEKLISDTSTFVKEALIQNDRTSYGQLRKIDADGEQFLINLLEEKGL